MVECSKTNFATKLHCKLHYRIDLHLQTLEITMFSHFGHLSYKYQKL